MIKKDKLLLNRDEYEAIVDYKWDWYSYINVMLTPNITMREMVSNFPNGMFPNNEKEFKMTIERAMNLYSGIRKNYNINGEKKYSKILFRGTRNGKIDKSFVSTSDSIETALEFVEICEGNIAGSGTLLMIEDSEVPYIDLNSIIAKGDSLEKSEAEVLFLPCQKRDLGEISLKECIEMARKQGEIISDEQQILDEFGKIKCCKVELIGVDYSKEKTDLTEEDLCRKFNQYIRSLKAIRDMDENSIEYKKTLQDIQQFKENCCTWLHQRFHEIDKNIINEMNVKNESIQISSNYEMEEVEIGNTGVMYLVCDKESGEEYYFKPAISKSGEERPYRAYIQETAYYVQKVINPENAVRCNVIEMGDVLGAVQEKIPIDREATQALKKYFDYGEGELPSKIIEQIMAEYLVDFCLCNYDSHARNFVIDKNGNLRGIDKEQSFRYIKEDCNGDMMFSTNYNEDYGESPSIYNILLEEMKQGKISYAYLKEVRYNASRLAQYPDDKYREIFKKYAYGKSKGADDAEALLDRIVDRKKDILDNFEDLYNSIYSQCRKNIYTTEYGGEIEETISMQSIVANAINKGITINDVFLYDKLESKTPEKIGGMTKDD